ncbi:MAG: carbon monoxide dehydrogenase [Clostridiales bacterium]|nr:carbon monoxide dehydrogenase [Clostridiales bacterium]
MRRECAPIAERCSRLVAAIPQSPLQEAFSAFTANKKRGIEMELYNSIIEKVDGLLGSTQPKRYEYNPAKCWEDVGGNQLVMMKEAAYELGGDNKPAVNYACVTSTDGFADKDEILLYGRDLNQINGSVPFARIVLIKVGNLTGENEEDTEPLFRAIQDIDFVKYHVYPKGYMIRSSSDSFREQVRVSKEAVRKGITFEQVGNSYIRQFKKNPDIKAVKMIFVTADDPDYAEMKKDAKKVRDITKTLSKILEGMSTDCHTCSLKEICDEVEGLKELHFGKEKKEFKG